MSELQPIDLAIHRAKVQAHRVLRWFEDRRDPLRPARVGRLLVDLPLIVEDRSPLWNRSGQDEQLDAREWPLELGKVENLRVAARSLDGLEFEARQVFSFWAQLGPPVRARGFVIGRELREGCVVPGVGGGLCLLSNALYAVATQAGFEILERHAHSRRPPGSRAALGADATVAWNYVDLRVRAAQPWRLEVRLDAEALVVAVRSERRRRAVRVLHDRRRVEPAAEERRAEERRRDRGSGGSSGGSPGGWAGEGGRSCMSCDAPCSFAHAPEAQGAALGRRSWLVDGAWPEYLALLSAEARGGDRLLQPIDGELLRAPRYAWPRPRGVERVHFPARTLARSLRSRRLASQGPARQRALLDDERRLAEAMAARLEPEDTELVVAQNLLPQLWLAGALGGRRVSVLMQRLPLFELQARLDEAAACNPSSPTLADFRADPIFVEAEARALDEAVEIVTPHAAISACYPGKTTRLDWALPELERRPRGRREPGPLRLWLPTSTVGRKGAWELRAALAELGPCELWVAGRELEGPGFWERGGRGVSLRHGSPTLDRVDAVVLPAWVEHQPRALLRALAAGVPVIASRACGLEASGGPGAGLRLVAAGDVEGLRAAIDELRARLGLGEAAAE